MRKVLFCEKQQTLTMTMRRMRMTVERNGKLDEKKQNKPKTNK